MSIAPIGSVPVLPTTPAASAALEASPLPFLLLTLAAPETIEIATDAGESLQTTAEEPPVEDAAPLIGWLFDSFAMALPPKQTDAAAPSALPTLDHGPAMKAPAPAIAVLADTVESDAELPAADDAATTTASFASNVLPDLALQTGSVTSAMFAAPPATATIAAAAQPAPVDGSGPPLVADAPDFSADLGERIAWQLDQDLGEATIELHPAELGALTIRIETQAQQAQVHIVAADPAARALLSQCLPQLRELLGASGMTLTRGQVESGERRGELAPGAGVPSPRMGRRRVTSVSLVDAYA